MLTATKQQSGVKTIKIIYWVTTSIFVLFDGAGALAFNSQLAIQGTRHLGFPDYFRVELGIAKIIGGLVLIIPGIPGRLKEWAYVGFGIATFSAIIANVAVDGWVNAIMPLVVLILLAVSYIYYHKLHDQRLS